LRPDAQAFPAQRARLTGPNGGAFDRLRPDDGLELPSSARPNGFRCTHKAAYTHYPQGVFTLVSLGAIVVVTAVLARAAEIVDDNARIV
jgi:hypothetical protein